MKRGTVLINTELTCLQSAIRQLCGCNGTVSVLHGLVDIQSNMLHLKYEIFSAFIVCLK